MLLVRNLFKSYGAVSVLEDVTFCLSPGDKVAVVGLNGAGKSTLLNIVAGRLPADSGTVTLTGAGERLGFMPQTLGELDLPDDMIVYDFLLSGRPIARIEAELNAIYAAAEDDPEALKRLNALQDELDCWGGYSAHFILDKMLAELDIGDETLLARLGDLSGGQKSKVSFVRTLYAAPDALLLDEPTNHLDRESKSWMERYLRATKSSVLFISHDEDFLNKLASKVLYLDAAARRASLYDCGYRKFLRLLAETSEAAERRMRNQMREIARVQAFIDRQKGKSGKIKRQAQSREKLVAKMRDGVVDVPKERRAVKVTLAPVRVERGIPIRVDGVSFGYVQGRDVIHKADFAVENGERFVIVGENGAGKSTMLKLMAGLLAPQAGIVTPGRKTDIGYYAQEHDDLDLANDVLTEAGGTTNLSEREARGILGAFNFTGDRVFQQVGTLSPGERSRLALAKLCMKGANLLLLDEPTNHLDVQTKRAVADALKDYGGTLVAVSHDVEFLETMGVDRMLVLPSCRIAWYDRDLVRRYMELEIQRMAKK